jgi:hypothetical protein
MRKTMTVKVHNIDQSQAMIFEGVDNTYVKAGFFCLVFRAENTVMKFPVSRIFRIIEPYNPEKRAKL